jgi:glutamate/tyrosine decarboxylase-like PLP-dependent enzyme
VDDLEEILDMRSDFEEKGLTFYIHVDAAWGGYFASVLRSKDGNQLNAVTLTPVIPVVKKNKTHVS